MDIQPFGTDQHGKAVHLITITNNKGMAVTLCSFGARLTGILCPDASGKLADVCLGFDSLEDYQTRSGYLGATIGRWANRIGGASFSLGGRDYPLYANNGANTLHGGQEGFDKKTWDVEVLGENQVRFSYQSPHMEEGFPGKLDIQVTYTLTDDGSLSIRYRAVCDQDTVINLTNHAYFNLAGEGSIHDHLLQVHADSVTAATEDLIPTGDFLHVEGTPYDLRAPRRIGDCLGMAGVNAMFDAASGFDINYVLEADGYAPAALLKHPASGRVMKVFTDQPGIQVYSGQGLKGSAKNGGSYGPYSGIALETQHFPDSVHHAHFPSTELRAGQVFESETVYQFTVEA